ncbi:MAG TPA: MarR family transcriptional regulator [Bacteroidia bacterium]|nr:MarR family transcriptional regulator [Bacteroidia bacterium]
MGDKNNQPRNLPAGFLLWQSANSWQRQMKTALTPVRLTHVQYLLLETLRNLSAGPEKATQVNLAKSAGIDAMMTSKVLRLLVRKKLVARKAPRHDARAFITVITPAGAALLNKARPLVEKCETAFFEKLVAKRKKFMANLHALAGN